MIYIIFNVSLLEYNTNKIRQMGKKFANLDLDLDLNPGNKKIYKMESIKNDVIYAKKTQA